jgi:hypothetical protein
MCWRPRRSRATSLASLKIRGPSCEIASDLRPNPFSHDWHVQPNCQRPNRFPPERMRIQSRRIWPTDRSLPCRNPTVLETFQPYRAPKNAVNAHIPQNFHEISTSGRSGRRTNGAVAFQRASKIGLPPGKALLERTRLLGHAKAEDRKLRKELVLEVLALKVPFRNLLVFPNRAPWPGRLRA